MKFKKINDDYFFTILDRLTRFEPACFRYERVFDDIISKFLFDSKIKNNLNLEDKIKIVEEIVANSIDTFDFNENEISSIVEIEEKYFKKNPISELYLKSKLNYKKIYEKVKKTEDIPYNIKFLENLINSKNIDELYKKRKEKKVLFPIEKIILCEGQTEFVLLKSIFKLFDFDLDKEGIIVIQAGGKNQVAKKYYKMIEYTKLPFFILLDKDGLETKELIQTKLRENDKLYLIKSGEFEDLIPSVVLLKAINYIHKNEIPCTFDDFDIKKPMVKNLDEIYKKYGFGEFKKAHFAQELKTFIEKYSDKIDFETSEVVEIAKTLQDM